MNYNRSERAQQLKNEARAGVFAKFLDIMIEVYGNPDLHSLERLIKIKHEGKEVEIYFTALDENVIPAVEKYIESFKIEDLEKNYVILEKDNIIIKEKNL